MIRNLIAVVALTIATLSLAGAVEPAGAVECAPGVVCVPPPCVTKSCPNYGPAPAPASDPVTAPASAPASSPAKPIKRCRHLHLGHLHR